MNEVECSLSLISDYPMKDHWSSTTHRAASAAKSLGMSNIVEMCEARQSCLQHRMFATVR